MRLDLLPAHLKCWRYHAEEGARIFAVCEAPGEDEGWFKNPRLESEDEPSAIQDTPKRRGRPPKVRETA